MYIYIVIHRQICFVLSMYMCVLMCVSVYIYQPSRLAAFPLRGKASHQPMSWYETE